MRKKKQKKNVPIKVAEQLIHMTLILIMHCQEIRQNVSDGGAGFSQTTQARIPDNDKHCEMSVKYERRMRQRGSELRKSTLFFAEGESRLNLRTHPLSRESAKVYPALQLTRWKE